MRKTAILILGIMLIGCGGKKLKEIDKAAVESSFSSNGKSATLSIDGNLYVLTDFYFNGVEEKYTMSDKPAIGIIASPKGTQGTYIQLTINSDFLKKGGGKVSQEMWSDYQNKILNFETTIEGQTKTTSLHDEFKDIHITGEIIYHDGLLTTDITGKLYKSRTEPEPSEFKYYSKIALKI